MTFPFNESGARHGEGSDGRPVCRGAMMGRPNVGEASEHPIRLRTRQVRLREGYDKGGAYWGRRPHGLFLFCLWSPDRSVVRYIDAAGYYAARLAIAVEFPNADFI